MEEYDSKLSPFTDDKGVFITLKNIKELKHGDKSTAIKVKTVQETYFIQPEINNDEISCENFKLYICKDKPKTKSAIQKVKLLSLCLQNGKQLGYTAPVSSQEDVNKMYNKI